MIVNSKANIQNNFGSDQNLEDWGTSVYVVLGFQENYMQSLTAFWLFYGYKKNSKSSVFFHSLIIEFLWFT